MFAQKNYLSGMYYLRRRAYDSGIIYFKDVLARYPSTPTVRLALLRLVDSYKAIHYKDDAQDACATLKKTYPNDAEVRTTCADVAAPVANSPTAVSNAPPDSTGPPTPTPATPPKP
jgi:outer membrane protein assembly factor BamD